MGANESHSGDSAGDTVSPPAFVESTISNVDLQLHDVQSDLCAYESLGSPPVIK
jgi:hypothetical protein